MLSLRNEIPAAHELARAEFDTIRLKLLKIGARMIETASRIRIHLASACPSASLFRLIAGAKRPAPSPKVNTKAC